MSKHLPTLLLACFISACGSAEVEQPGPPPVDPRVYQPTAARVVGPQKSPLERDRDAAGRSAARSARATPRRSRRCSTPTSTSPSQA